MRIFEVERCGGPYCLSSCRPEQKKTTRQIEVQTNLVSYVEEKLSFFIM